MSRGSHRVDGSYWTTWISWCTSFIRNCGSSTSSSACGAMPPCWRRAPRTAARKDDGHATDRRDRGGARAIGRSAARSAVRAEQGPVPSLRFPDHPNRALRALLLSGRAQGGVGRRADGRAVVCPPVPHPAPPVPGPEADHLVRVLIGLPADEHQRGEEVPEGVVAFTDPFKHRMVIPFTGSYADFEHVMGHEMVHQFQFDVYSRGRIGGVQTLVNVNPPLWFMEGMAEYLSLGPIDNHTAMWLRDASLEGHLPTLQQLTYEQVFPYYFGHAMWAFIGEKWGDEAIGQILQASVSGGGIEGSFKRTLGVTLDDLVSQWRDAVQTTYLPQLADHYRARRIAQPLLTQKRSDGTLHLAPALTPDGRQIAYFSEKNSFFVDLYLADAETGKVLRRLVKSTLSSNYESLRFINSAGSFSPDGRYFAIAAKRKDRDDLVILDVKKDEEVRRIPLPLNGLTTPSWSPDSKELVFTGYDGGISDLFVVNADGSGLHRLTNDKYADLQPSWAPDGKTIAFATDRGGKTDFDGLRFGNMRIALFHLDNGKIDLLGHMDQGKNIDPAWAPDGKSLAFVSDRSGISNVFLYDLSDANIYQLTDVYTGVSGITPLSPCLSWAHEADRLAFAYYEEGEYNVYAVDNPRSLRRQPYQPPATMPVTSLLAAQQREARQAAKPPAEAAAPAPAEEQRGGASVYRSPTGFRASGSAPQSSDSGAGPAPVSVKALLDSSPALPDTTEFTLKDYH